MNHYSFHPGPKCGNCKAFDRNRDKNGQPTDRYHSGAFCRFSEDPKICSDAFRSRGGKSKKIRRFKHWQQVNIQ